MIFSHLNLVLFTVGHLCPHQQFRKLQFILQLFFFVVFFLLLLLFFLKRIWQIAKRFTFYTKHLNLPSKCSKFRFETFQNKIKFKKFNFVSFKGFLILTKFCRKIRQICQLSLSFKKTQLSVSICDCFCDCYCDCIMVRSRQANAKSESDFFFDFWHRLV